ncbi:TPA: hypothetical protein DD425_01410 [Candidatus Saccharibacteria bacterium]|nr:hypothetical protein [Candidatus Saccharibacteria bacterium]|tara:strand:+ start:688 stop:2073 length:1386 start_codon:yes stop_codon:yes gene_type:complete
MKTIDIARRAARSLRSAKTRTILTSLAIGVGAFTIAISIAAGEGARQYADTLIGSNINPRALFIVKDGSLFEGGASPLSGSGIREYDPDVGMTASGASIKLMTQEQVDELAARSDLENVVPTYSPSVTYMVFGDSDKKFSADVAAYDATITGEAAYGTLPPLGEGLAADEVVMPESFATTLVEQGVIDTEADLVGTRVVMTASRPTSTATADELAQAYATGGAAAVAALSQPETKEFAFTVRALSKQSATALVTGTSIQIPVSAAREMSEYTTEGTPAYQRYVGVQALAVEGEDPDEVKAALLEDEFYAQTAEDLQGVIFSIVNILQGIVLGFGVIALIASVFGIINTQYISVLERTREIGLMKALGMRGGGVSRLFQFEAAWIGFLGGVIGAAIAVVLGILFNPTITELLGLGEGNYLLIFQPLPLIGMVIVLMLIAMLAGWFPARKAAKLDPIEALRTE